MQRDVKGIGLQFNPTTIPLLDQLPAGCFDFGELLCDLWAAPTDCGYVIEPLTRPLFDRLVEQYPLEAHGNYGEDFGYKPIDDTVSVRRHLPIARAMNAAWYTNHMFFGPPSSSYMWSTPLQFSDAEAIRAADRARALQDRFGMPVLHENAFYYATFPGSALPEAEFMAKLVERSGTYLMLDIHNIYANSKNFEGYDPWQYVKTIPLDRVLQVHLAGGQYIDDWYHDLHNDHAPTGVWELLDYVLRHAPNLRGVVLEVQGPAHTPRSRDVDANWIPMIVSDLARARASWDAVRGTPATGR